MFERFSDNKSVMTIVIESISAYLVIIAINYIFIGSKTLWHSEGNKDKKANWIFIAIFSFAGLVFVNAYLSEKKITANEMALDKKINECVDDRQKNNPEGHKDEEDVDKFILGTDDYSFCKKQYSKSSSQ